VQWISTLLHNPFFVCFLGSNFSLGTQDDIFAAKECFAPDVKEWKTLPNSQPRFGSLFLNSSPQRTLETACWSTDDGQCIPPPPNKPFAHSGLFAKGIILQEKEVCGRCSAGKWQ